MSASEATAVASEVSAFADRTSDALAPTEACLTAVLMLVEPVAASVAVADVIPQAVTSATEARAAIAPEWPRMAEAVPVSSSPPPTAVTLRT